MNSEDKCQLKVWVSHSCLDRLRKHITHKYPDFKKGWLSLEVENLINQGIARFKEGKLGEQHTHTLRQSKKHQEFLRVKGGVINYLVDKFGDPIAVPERDVREAIMATTDRRDKRTVDAWLKIMFAKGLFREAAGNRIIIQDEFTDTDKETKQKDEEADRILRAYQTGSG
jgi:hypothetical protein